MKKFLKPKYILFVIVLLAAFLRFYNLSINPPALNWDEAALGYNAYLLGIDGKDEFGKTLPLAFIESYGDYKPVVYSYLSIVPVRIFGLNELGVRFLSAFLGTFTVLLTYFLVKQIFYKKENENIESIALFSSFIIAISPWTIMLSRGAYEANVSTFFIVLGILFFLYAVNKKIWFLVPSAISLAITFYTFNTARIFIPLVIVVMAIVFRKVLIKNYKQVLISGIVGLIILLPTLPFLFSPQAKIRFQEVNIFSNPKIVEDSNQYIVNDNGAIWSKIIHNRRVLYGIEFSKHYFDNLNPDFLFIKGDGNPRFSTQDVGQLYLIELPFLISGIFLLFRKREGHYWLIPVWFLLGIIPAATARETPHALRIETVIPMLQILVAYGAVNLIIMMKKYRGVAYSLIILFMLGSLIYFYHGLIFHYPREYSSEWQYPYKEAVAFANKNKDKYSSVLVTEKLGRPYIYFLLYGKVSPVEFRQSSKIDREALGFVHVRSFDKYKFVNEIEKEQESGVLYIDVPNNLPKDVKVLKEFRLLNGDQGLVAYEKN